MVARILHSFFSFILFCVIIFPMGLFNWGPLPKAQDNPQLITEAIDEAIQAHNDDPDAHLGTGQSLQSHKASEIIDHLAGSVLADKFSDSEGIFETSFDSVDAWVKTGQTELISWGDFNLYADHDVSSHSQAYVVNPYALVTFDLSKDFCYQTTLYITKDSVSKVNFGLGYFGSTPTNNSAGFHWDNSTFKAYVRISGTTYFSSSLTVDFTKANVFRILNVASDKKIEFYINGVLVNSYTYASSSTLISDYLFYDVSIASAGEVILDVNKLSIARALD